MFCFNRLTQLKMKKVVSGGPKRAMVFTRAGAGLPDTIPLN
jgi:hypothetical protein